MTEIVLKRENGSVVYFEADGHTGYAEAGQDIICASLSSVIWCTVNGLENVLGADISYSEEDGHVTCLIKNPSRETDILLNSFDKFLDALQKQYPDFITKTEV
ncbi:MAG: ribosomal-processing cysteine protease Prp [Clostridia bacterium]|nr:ribosomal-processing cysteine protease Prp [Clostridia bacterium]